MRAVAAGIADYTPGTQVMTDDRAPVELLGMRMLDVYISDELHYYQDILHKDGLAGLIQAGLAE